MSATPTVSSSDSRRVVRIAVDGKCAVTTRFLGFGLQTCVWEPVSEAEFDQLAEMIGELRPGIGRAFLDLRWWRDHDERFLSHLERNLALYDELGVPLALVLWRPLQRDGCRASVMEAVERFSEIIHQLSKIEGHACIRWVSLFNEPNLEFANRELLLQATRVLKKRLDKLGLGEQIGLVGAGDLRNSRWFRDAIVHLPDIVDHVSTHVYPRRHEEFLARCLGRTILRGVGHSGSQRLVRKRLRTIATDGSGQRLVIWEFNASDAMGVAEFCLSALSAGVAGMSFWDAYDFHVPSLALFERSEGKWRLTDKGRIYRILTNCIRPEATILKTEVDDSARIRAVAALCSGTRVLLVLNRSRRPVRVRIDGLDEREPVRLATIEPGEFKAIHAR